jgi:hypothetical protein
VAGAVGAAGAELAGAVGLVESDGEVIAGDDRAGADGAAHGAVPARGHAAATAAAAAAAATVTTATTGCRGSEQCGTAQQGQAGQAREATPRAGVAGAAGTGGAAGTAATHLAHAGGGRRRVAGLAEDAAQRGTECLIALRHGHQRVMAAPCVHQRAAVAERGAAGHVVRHHDTAAVCGGQGRVAGRGRLALHVVVLQGDPGAVGVIELQVVAVALGEHVAGQLGFAVDVAQHPIVFTGMHLDQVRLARIERLCRFAVVERKDELGRSSHGLSLYC